MTEYYYMVCSTTEINCTGEYDNNKPNLLIYFGDGIADEDNNSVGVGIQPIVIKLPNDIDDILERNTVKEPIKLDDSVEVNIKLTTDIYRCPLCNNILYDINKKYCSNCGQKLT